MFRYVLSLVVAVTVFAIAVGDANAIGRRSGGCSTSGCSTGGGCNVGSNGCNVGSSQGCNIQRSAPISVVAPPAVAPAAAAPQATYLKPKAVITPKEEPAAERPVMVARVSRRAAAKFCAPDAVQNPSRVLVAFK